MFCQKKIKNDAYHVVVYLLVKCISCSLTRYIKSH